VFCECVYGGGGGRGGGGGELDMIDRAEGSCRNHYDRATIQGLSTANIEGKSLVCCKTWRVGSVAPSFLCRTTTT
jgi:hypothetical protein